MSKNDLPIGFYGYYYNDLTLFRALVSAIPGIGGQLDLILSTPGQKYAEERLIFMIEQLSKEMESLNEEKINNTFFETEEGYDLLQKGFIAAVKTRQKEKLKVFAKILRGASTKQDKRHDPERYLRIVDEITEQELELALILYNVKVLKTHQEVGRDVDWYPTNFPKFPREEFETSMLMLENVGLAKPITGRFDGGGSYETTTLLRDLLEFIKNGHDEKSI